MLLRGLSTDLLFQTKLFPHGMEADAGIIFREHTTGFRCIFNIFQIAHDELAHHPLTHLGTVHTHTIQQRSQSVRKFNGYCLHARRITQSRLFFKRLCLWFAAHCHKQEARGIEQLFRQRIEALAFHRIEIAVTLLDIILAQMVDLHRE